MEEKFLAGNNVKRNEKSGRTIFGGKKTYISQMRKLKKKVQCFQKNFGGKKSDISQIMNDECLSKNFRGKATGKFYGWKNE